MPRNEELPVGRALALVKLLRTAGCASALVAFAAASAVAQCPMCGQAVEYAGSKPGAAYETFYKAALVLLIPVVFFAASVGLLLRKYRH